MRDAGVVDQDIDLAKGVQSGGEQGVDVGFAADVGLEEAGGIAERVCCRRAVGTHVGQHHARAFLDEALGAGEADALAGSGDDGDFLGEFHGGVSWGGVIDEAAIVTSGAPVPAGLAGLAGSARVTASADGWAVRSRARRRPENGCAAGH